MVNRYITVGLKTVAIVSLLFGIAALPSIACHQARAQTTPTALTEPQDVNGHPGLVMELTQCKLDGNMLSIRLRIRNTSTTDVKGWAFVENRVYIDQFYVLAANKKYLVLRDTDKVPLATPGTHDSGWALDVEVPANGTYTWYAKYPAPPPDVKKISFYTPYTLPFEDVPISQ